MQKLSDRESKMSVYSISSINVKDWETYEKYMKKVPGIIEKYGGKYLVRGGEILADDTTWQPKRIVILEFLIKLDLETLIRRLNIFIFHLVMESFSEQLKITLRDMV